jgi:CRP-like cAMP-binding protein
MDQLERLINTISPLDEPAWKDFSAIWRPFSAHRKEPITQAGEVESYLYFIVEGVQRVYYFDDAGREATLVFSYAPSFGGVIDSFMTQQPARYHFETLTASRFLRASFRDLQPVMQTHRSVETAIRVGLTQVLSGLLERLAEIQCYSSTDKLTALLKRSPHILQRVPHKYLANYIGVDPTNFSKLINTIRI